MIEFSTIVGAGFAAEPTFEAMRFPAGEAHVKVANEHAGSGKVTEVARLCRADANDLLTLAMWADACHQRGALTIAQIPYLPGARQDRGLPFGAKVYADLINGMHIDRIVAVDVHSPVMEHMIERLGVVNAARIVRKHVVGRPDSDEHAQRFQGIIAPDKGAYARAKHVADICALPLYQAEKHRDSNTGKLSGFTCQELPDEGNFLLVDDICDGGGTFIGLAEATGLPYDRLGLFVTHGVFSEGAYRLRGYYDHIWMTDSFAPSEAATWLADAGLLTTIPLAPYLNGALN